MQLQRNKVQNLRLATAQIDGILIAPGEIFSLWALIGRPTRKKGYLDGLVISSGHLGKGVAGGLCQLANLIHYMVLHTPMKVTELHHHSDALFPDAGRGSLLELGLLLFTKTVTTAFKTQRRIQCR